MDCRVGDGIEHQHGLGILVPAHQRLPVVLASPHSGRDYPDDFLAATRLDPHTLRKSEDSYVDEIFGHGPRSGAPLLKAMFPRALLDTNREAFELDPEMFQDLLPAYVNTRSPRVAAGLGTIAKVVAHGQEIYRGKLRFAEALARVDRFYYPYHTALRMLVDDTLERFGYCLLVDCHSMPSNGGTGERHRNGRRVDFVLGDCYGRACNPTVTDTIEQWLSDQGYIVNRNTPYAGGFTTRHYGRPRAGVHSIQIEINRSIYMDESHIKRKPYIGKLAGQMGALVERLGSIDEAALKRR